MNNFSKKQPSRRTDAPSLTSYRDYLPYLSEDFNRRCGYTDSSHRYWSVNFHVDHFAPLRPNVSKNKKQAFLDGELIYNNLVYACPQVNWAKSNDWPSDNPVTTVKNDRGYYDPCSTDFNDHFYRTSGGAIMPKEDDRVAIYMWSQLKLYLKRYEIYWRLDTLREKRQKLTALSEKVLSGSNHELEILRLLRDFTNEIDTYENYLDLYKAEVA
ncbi:hypothetical protein KDA00_05970 [Candidatus Saccharibacteria bacterium]|nr:hypothetical protein [Candidatus Saccharibacteria bacterium]